MADIYSHLRRCFVKTRGKSSVQIQIIAPESRQPPSIVSAGLGFHYSNFISIIPADARVAFAVTETV
jgi:hypothetical protein